MNTEVLLGIGSSLGDRRVYIQIALKLLDTHAQIDMLRISRIYRSVPLGNADALFWNLCCIVRTSMSPNELLRTVKKIERKVGRRKSKRWANRVLDIDILLYGTESFDSPSLTIPHVQFCARAFVLQPAMEIASHWFHPLEECFVKDLSVPSPRCWCN
jgi:2-amino-4-hydroxy-6-hydroxymethyldihydropteridine diphosphokinase